ncbi:hypothetical protein ACOSQ3_009501 [Xanthoceras sorbifolium]
MDIIPAGSSLHRQPPPHLASSSSSLPRQPPHLAISVVADFLLPQAALCRLSLQINRLPVFLAGCLTSPTLLQQISSPAAAPRTSHLTAHLGIILKIFSLISLFFFVKSKLGFVFEYSQLKI